MITPSPGSVDIYGTLSGYNLLLSFPEFVVLVLLGAAVGSYLFRHWERWTALAVGLLLTALAVWLTVIPLSAEVQTFGFLPLGVDPSLEVSRYGFVFHIDDSHLPILVLSLGITAAVLLISGLTRQGGAFVPFSLVVLTGYVGLNMLHSAPVEPIVLIPLGLAILTALNVFGLQSGQLGETSGPLRSLLPPVLAFPFFLPVAWYLDQVQLDPQNNEPFLVAGWLLAVGLLLLVAPVPLHGGWPATAQSAPPLAVVLVTHLHQLTVLYLLYQVGSRFAFAVELVPLNLWLTVGGLLTAVWGGLAAAGSVDPGKLWGYALLHDWGIILVILAVPGSRSWPLVLFLFMLRVVSTLAAAMGLAQLRDVLGAPLTPERLRGMGTRFPWTTSAYLLGILGLVGFPLSAGFPGHWAAIQLVAETEWRLAATVLLCSSGVVVGVARLTRTLFGSMGNRWLPAEGRIVALVAALILLVCAGVAVAPQILRSPVTWALMAFST